MNIALDYDDPVQSMLPTITSLVKIEPSVNEPREEAEKAGILDGMERGVLTGIGDFLLHSKRVFRHYESLSVCYFAPFPLNLFTVLS